ncbi:MAG TPA: pesticidal protein Cry7Aa [bacterium]|nr:pesticidal protein Cry7Aa [bacterium]HPL95404.1 pesticidal protein Cry7Aa [bacterium]
MLKVKKLGILLKPTKNSFESRAVLNPGIYQDGKNIHLFYRAVNHLNESCIGYARLFGPTKIVERDSVPLINREYTYEAKGIEDPRIVKIGDTFYLTYVAFDGKNALTALASSKNLKQFEKRGIIAPLITYDKAEDFFRKSTLKDQYAFFESFFKDKVAYDMLLWEKDIFLFPEKIKGKFALVHRILPEIQIIYFRDFKELTPLFWRKYLKQLSKFVLLEKKHWYESRNIGGGAPPIKTNKGWLLIYHGVEETNQKKVYHAGAALLDLKDPQKVLGRLRDPLFSPTESYEKKGEISNVVFPTGTAIFGKYLYIYYGCADKRIAVAKVNLNDLLRELLKSGN